MMAKLKRELYLMTFKVTPFHGYFMLHTEKKKIIYLFRFLCASSFNGFIHQVNGVAWGNQK